jgi:hypothetical protein
VGVERGAAEVASGIAANKHNSAHLPNLALNRMVFRILEV